MNHDQSTASLAALEEAHRNQHVAVLEEYFERSTSVLQSSSDYEELRYALRVLRILGPYLGGRLLTTLEPFIDTVSGRALTMKGEPLPASTTEYGLSSDGLVWTAFEVALAARRTGVVQLTDLLLDYASSSESALASKATATLEHLAAVDQRMAHENGRFDVSPQREMMCHFEEMSDISLMKSKTVLLTVLRSFLMPTSDTHPGVDGGIWSYRMNGHYLLSVESNRGSCVQPTEGLPEARKSAFGLLKRMYALDPGESVMEVMFASISLNPDNENAYLAQLVECDALDLLSFLQAQVSDTDLQRSLHLEILAFFCCYRNGTPAMKNAALSLRDTILSWPLNATYIGIFETETWEAIDYSIRHPETPRKTGDQKNQVARERFISLLDERAFVDLREQIDRFCKTQREPSFNWEFGRLLEAVGKERPHIAMRLLRDSEAVRRYLPQVLHGLWESDRRSEAAELASQWVLGGKYVAEVSRSMPEVPHPELEVLSGLLKSQAHAAAAIAKFDD